MVCCIILCIVFAVRIIVGCCVTAGFSTCVVGAYVGNYLFIELVYTYL